MYSFRDTTAAASPAAAIPAEALSIDGTYLDGTLPGYRTLTVSGRESLEYDITDSGRALGAAGAEYYGKRLKTRTLAVKFELQAGTAAEFLTRYSALKAACIGENKKIRFADKPDAHYIGTLEAIDPPDAGRLHVVAEMSFYCADPYLISDVTTVVTAAAVNGVMTAHVDNDGTGPVYPTFRVKNGAKENGYLGIVHAGGALEIGNRDEVDTTPYTASETLISGFSAFSPFTGTNPQNSAITLGGTLGTTADGAWTVATSFGSGSAWHGGCKRAVMPADSNGDYSGAKNFYCWFESAFETGAMGQTGLQQVLLTDADNNFIAGFGIYKADKVGNSAHVIFWGPGGAEIRDTPLTPSAYIENPYTAGRGCEDILKQGADLRFYFYGRYYNYYFPAIENKKVKFIYIVIGNYGDGSYTTINKVGRFSATKNMVDKALDVPNRYPAGAETVINCEADSVTVNGFPRNDEIITGSEFPALDPGGTDIEFYVSSWCTEKPTITVEYNKRWL